METQAHTAHSRKDDDRDDKDKKTVTIVVNGREKVVPKDELTFAEVVALADGLPSGQFIVYTITYRRGPDDNKEGTLVEGASVKVKNGMIFNVTATDKS